MHQHLKDYEVDNFAKVISACFLIGDNDLNTNNLGFINLNNGKKCFAKVDHGEAFKLTPSAGNPEISITLFLKVYTQNSYPLEMILSKEFAVALESICEKANDAFIKEKLQLGFRKLGEFGDNLTADRSFESFFNIVKANRDTLLDLAKLIRLRNCIINGEVESFNEILKEGFNTFENLSDVKFVIDLEKPGSPIHPDVYPLRTIVEELAPEKKKKKFLDLLPESKRNQIAFRFDGGDFGQASENPSWSLHNNKTTLFASITHLTLSLAYLAYGTPVLIPATIISGIVANYYCASNSNYRASIFTAVTCGSLLLSVTNPVVGPLLFTSEIALTTAQYLNMGTTFVSMAAPLHEIITSATRYVNNMQLEYAQVM
jgi:hypothetical protein